MDARQLDEFDKELEVEYRDEIYLVRDNGSVCRKHRPDKRKRQFDDAWTFGTPSAITGYMNVGSEVVHRIVATAFHGPQPSEKHIVDQIDTNRRNNRADNLRWITRLDNVLLNPITRRRIILAYGSIEAFVKNPAAPIQTKLDKNFDWMRTVSKEEAEKSLSNLLQWAESDQTSKGEALGEWIFGEEYQDEPVVEDIPDGKSLTPNAIQRNWKTPTEFVMCPDETSCEKLGEYASRLKFGTVFARNAFSESLTVIATEADGVLSVLCKLPENPVKEWALAKVTIENGKFVHENVRSYFSLQGALKEHCNLLGVAFEESIDDYT